MKMHSIVRGFAWCVLATLVAGPVAAQSRPAGGPPADYAAKEAAWKQHRALDEASLFKGLAWRNVGPVVQGGRVVDVESIPGRPYTFYVAYASGGLWRTTNNGVTFDPLFDDQPTLVIGDIAIDPQNPSTLWVGTGENNSSRSSYAGTGVYRSDDEGETWRWVGLGDTDRIGRVLVHPENSDRVWVASTGKLYTEGGPRGVFRTDDGGKSWKQVLDTGKDGWTGVIDMALDPSNPEVLYAAAWERSRRPWNFVESGPGSGIYKSTDGGSTWNRLAGGFPRGEHVGRIGLAVSPSNPRIVYASIDNQELLPEDEWDLGDNPLDAKRLRKMTKQEFLANDPDDIESFLRGNDFHEDLTGKKLIKMIEKDELTIQDLLDELDDANANLFNTDIRGLEVYRSDDAGATWRRTHDKPIRDVIFTYGYYFGVIRVAPDNPDRIYCVGVPVITSDDGGKTWSGLNGRGVHVDHHEWWIDPSYPDRMMTGNDGGVDITYDGGKSWLKLDSQPVGQFYTVEVDMAKPYNVYGGLQDNGSLKGSSQGRPGDQEWQRIGGGDGMYVQVDPDTNDIYAGFQFGFYFRSGPGGRATVRPRDKLKEPALRYNWSSPILLSSHNRDIVYFGTNMLYRSMDKGETWTAISPDLTTSNERGDVPFATITTIAESPEAFGLLWVGTDDGNVHVSEDGGVEWRDVGAGLVRDRWVTRVEASHHERDRAYVSFSGYRDDDILPYVYVTEDLGRTWRSISGNLPAEPINVVREDPVNADVLWVGTDRGAYVSLDRGATWQGLPGGLPNVPVHDLIVHPRDRELVAGTHGRSIWILDALPIQDLTPELQKEAVHVFPVENMRYGGWSRRRSEWFDRSDRLPELKIPFWTASAGKAVLTVTDKDDRPLATAEMDVERGVQTMVWDLRLDEKLALAAEKAANEKPAKGDQGDEKKGGDKKAKKKDKDEEAAAAEDSGPKKGSLAKTPWAEAVRLERELYATPGKYKLRIEVGGESATTDFSVDGGDRRRGGGGRRKPELRGRKDDDD